MVFKTRSITVFFEINVRIFYLYVYDGNIRVLDTILKSNLSTFNCNQKFFTFDPFAANAQTHINTVERSVRDYRSKFIYVIKRSSHAISNKSDFIT